MATATDFAKFSNISATTALFTLRGGLYAVAVHATFGGGSVKLQTLLPDGATVLSVSAGTDFTADGYNTVNLPPGQYQFTITTATAVFVKIGRAHV